MRIIHRLDITMVLCSLLSFLVPGAVAGQVPLVVNERICSFEEGNVPACWQGEGLSSSRCNGSTGRELPYLCGKICCSKRKTPRGRTYIFPPSSGGFTIHRPRPTACV